MEVVMKHSHQQDLFSSFFRAKSFLETFKAELVERYDGGFSAVKLRSELFQSLFVSTLTLSEDDKSENAT